MPRRRPDRARPGRARPAPPPLLGGAGERVEAGPDGEDWHVRSVPSARAVKTYRCPGCDQVVAIGTPHVLAWPSDELGGVDERRHWHTGCWAGRGRRGLTRRWS